MAYRDRIEELRRRIIAQADAAGDQGWLDIPVPAAIRPGGPLRVPRGAFEGWAVWRSHGGHLAAPWTPVSPVGVKQGADDPYHTDWMLGAGLAPRDMRHDGGNPHAEVLSDAAHAARSGIEQRLLGFRCSVLLPGPDVEGRVLTPARPGAVDWQAADGGRPVLVLRDAAPAWLADVLRALDEGGAVIVERGGEMAHLITEARAHGRGPVVRVPDACRLYPEGAVLEVSAARGSVRLAEQLRAFDAPLQDGAWDPRDGADAVPEPWSPPPGTHGFGLHIHAGGPFPFNHLDFMEMGCKVDGREYTAAASVHFRDRTAEADILAVHVFARDSRKRFATVVSAMRTWKDGEIARACREALYLAVPAEHPDSPQSQAAVAAQERQQHQWWQARGYGALGDGDLVARATAGLRDRAALVAEWGEGLHGACGGALDALESYRCCFRHFDIEFRQRGLGVTMLDLEIRVEDQDAMEKAAASATP